MKKLSRPAITIVLSLTLAFLSAAVTSPAPVFPLRELSGATLQQAAPTPHPQAQNKSEMGSTDGMVAMVVIIVLIVFVPILINRKTWR